MRPVGSGRGREMQIETFGASAVRQVDDLGRIVIPRDLRRELGVVAGDSLELTPCVLDGHKGVFVTAFYSERARFEQVAAPMQASLKAALGPGTRGGAGILYRGDVLLRSGLGQTADAAAAARYREGFRSLEQNACYLFQADGRYSGFLAPIRAVGEVIGACYILTEGDPDPEASRTLSAVASMAEALLR